MPQPYNVTPMSEANNLWELTDASNDVTSGLLGKLFLMGLFIILFIVFKRFETKRAFSGAAFITALAAVFMRIAGLIPDTYMIGSFLLVGVSLIWLKLSN